MFIDLATVALMGSLQGLLLAVVLWTSTGGYAGVARTSLRIRASALAIEAASLGILGLFGQLHDPYAIVLSNLLVLVAYAATVWALRMLLGARQRHGVVIAASVSCALAMTWFSVVSPNANARALAVSVAIMLDLLLMLTPLLAGVRQGASLARRSLLLILAASMLVMGWRIVDLMQVNLTRAGLLAPSLTNTVYVLLWSIQPLFTSIGFLLIYNETIQHDLHLLARIDPLTGVGNRLAIEEATVRLLAQADRQRQSLGVLMLDADHFKGVNDRFGHSGGDKVLQALVCSIRATLRDSDVIGRIGGEEFVVLSPATDMESALMLGERIRDMVESMPQLIDGQMLKLTVSVGVAVAAPAERDGTAVLQRADKALYAAKRAGRNCVMAATASKEDGNPLPA